MACLFRVNMIICFSYISVFLTVTALSNTWSLSNVMLASTQINQADLTLSASVSAGADLASQECADQFKTDVWNCPRAAFRTRREERANTRETAFIQAIMSAGVTHTLTQNCSKGGLEHCECEPRKKGMGGWKWGGCSANVMFGEQVSKQFLDSFEGGNDPKSLANLHNNEAGRVAVKKTMRQLCKCHGVSGSCATQTCWRQLSSFRTTGNYLKKQYNRALRVDYNKGNNVMDKLDNLITNRIEPIPRQARSGKRGGAGRKNAEKVKKRKLVYMQKSPDYCRMNATAGYKGMVGRVWETDPNSPSQKQEVRKYMNLCRQCRLYVKKKVVDVVTSCNCKFEWCCNVSCQSCHKKQVRIQCVPTN